MRRAGLILQLFVVAAAPAMADALPEVAYPTLGGIELCQPMASVRALYPSSTMTTVTSEGQTWPAARVDLGKTTWLLFEASWVDHGRIWRISTNDPGYATRRGYRVGTSVAELVRRGEKLDFDYPEGHLVVRIASENVGTLLDDDATNRFWARFDYSGDPLTVLDHNARIKQLSIVRNCDNREKPPNSSIQPPAFGRG